MKLLRSKNFYGCICILLAGVFAFWVVPKLYSSQSATTFAIKAAQNIPAGTIISKNMISVVEVGAYGLSDDYLSNPEDVVGMVADEDIYAGEFLIPQRFITEEQFLKEKEEKDNGLQPGLCLVALKLPSTSSGLAGFLRAGDLVDVFEKVDTKSIDEATGESIEATSVVKVLSSMYVHDVLNSDLESMNDLDEKLALLLPDEASDYDFIPTYVVFRCTQAHAEMLIRLEATGALHLTLTNSEG